MTITPGPWRQSNNELGYGEYDVLAENLGWPNIGIATVVDARFSDPSLGSVALDRDTCNANARLIAAAPELLEALEYLHKAFQDPDWRTRYTLLQACAMMDKLLKNVIDPAIAKAKGKP